MSNIFHSYRSANTHSFVCKKVKPDHNPTPVPPPTEIPPGHCPDDGSGKLVEFQGYCYKLYALEGMERLTVDWYEARSKCEELEGGYKIASFHSERESSFVYTMLAQLDLNEQGTDFWFAANDIRWQSSWEGNWANADETPFDYTNWAEGEPNGSELVGLDFIL